MNAPPTASASPQTRKQMLTFNQDLPPTPKCEGLCAAKIGMKGISRSCPRGKALFVVLFVSAHLVNALLGR